MTFNTEVEKLNTQAMIDMARELDKLADILLTTGYSIKDSLEDTMIAIERYEDVYEKYQQPRKTLRVRSRVKISSYEDLVFSDRGSAEDILNLMIDRIIDYGMVTVGDLYDFVGITGSFTDEYWGWTDLSNSGVKRTRDGYVLALPRAVNVK